MEGHYRPQQPGLRKLLGDLEADIMEAVWSAGQTVTVREVYEQLRLVRRVAYTTVMTVMGNLVKKGVLTVEKEGTAYLYRAPLSREAYTRQAIGEILDGILVDFADAAIAHFSRPVAGPDDPLAALQSRIDELRPADADG